MANVIQSVAPATPAPAIPVIGVSAHPSAAPVTAQAVEPVVPVQTGNPGGNRQPAGGDSLPAQAAAAQPDVVQLTAAVAGVNRFLRDSQRQMLFQYDPHSGKESVTIVNPATGEVIRQIPSAQVLQTANSLQEAGILLPGLFIDETA
jgi:uncharacterized FlaG/YvyC family protein